MFQNINKMWLFKNSQNNEQTRAVVNTDRGVFFILLG